MAATIIQVPGDDHRILHIEYTPTATIVTVVVMLDNTMPWVQRISFKAGEFAQVAAAVNAMQTQG